LRAKTRILRFESLEQRALLSVNTYAPQFQSVDFTATGGFSGQSHVPVEEFEDYHDTYSGEATVSGTMYYQDEYYGAGFATGTATGTVRFSYGTESGVESGEGPISDIIGGIVYDLDGTLIIEAAGSVAEGSFNTANLTASATWDIPLLPGSTVGDWSGWVDVPTFDTAVSWAAWRGSGVYSSYEATGLCPISGDRGTPVTDVQLFWNSGPESGQRLIPATSGSAPIYWNLASGSAFATGLIDPPLAATHLLVVSNPDWQILEPDYRDNFFALPLPDIEPINVQWNPQFGGFNFSYKITGGNLREFAPVDFYWANETTVFYLAAPSRLLLHTEVGIHEKWIPGFYLTSAPLETTQLLVVVDPADVYPRGLLEESNEDNNVVALPDVKLTGVKTALTSHTFNVLKGILRYAGEKHVRISRTRSTPQEQAVIMYKNLEKGAGRNYKPAGQEVIAVYDDLKRQGERDPNVIIPAMVAKINKIIDRGDCVSRHCTDFKKENVVDIAPSTVSNHFLFMLGVFVAIDQGKVSKFLPPDKNEPAFHIVIPQSKSNRYVDTDSWPPQLLRDSPYLHGADTKTDPLSPATPINLSSGFGEAAGAVSTGHEIFSFEASVDNSITLTTLVTEIFPAPPTKMTTRRYSCSMPIAGSWRPTMTRTRTAVSSR